MVIENKKSNIDVLNVKKEFIIKGDINNIIEQLQEKKEKYDIYKTNKQFFDEYFEENKFGVEVFIDQQQNIYFEKNQHNDLLLTLNFNLSKNNIFNNFLESLITDAEFKKEFNLLIQKKVKSKFLKIKKDIIKSGVDNGSIFYINTILITLFDKEEVYKILKTGDRYYSEYLLKKFYHKLDYFNYLLPAKHHMSTYVFAHQNNMGYYNLNNIIKDLLNIQKISSVSITESDKKDFFENKKELFNIINKDTNIQRYGYRVYYNKTMLIFNVFYGLYFNLFSNKELELLEKQGILYMLSKKIEEKDFYILLNRSNYKLKYFITLDRVIDFAENNYYPNVKLISKHKYNGISSKTLMLNTFVSEMLKHNYKIIITSYNKGIYNDLIENIDILAALHNLSTSELNNIFKARLFKEEDFNQ